MRGGRLAMLRIAQRLNQDTIELTTKPQALLAYPELMLANY